MGNTAGVNQYMGKFPCLKIIKGITVATRAETQPASLACTIYFFSLKLVELDISSSYWIQSIQSHFAQLVFFIFFCCPCKKSLQIYSSQGTRVRRMWCFQRKYFNQWHLTLGGPVLYYFRTSLNQHRALPDPVPVEIISLP